MRITFLYVTSILPNNAILIKNFGRRLNRQKHSKNIIIKHPPENCIDSLSSHHLTTQKNRSFEFGLNISQFIKPSILKLFASFQSFKYSKISASQKDSLRYTLSDTIACNNNAS